MKNHLKSRKKISLANLIIGYTLAVAFIILVMLNVKKPEPIVETITEIVEVNNTIIEEKTVYMSTDIPPSRYVDHLDGVVLTDTDPVVAVVDNDPLYVDRGIVIDDTHRIGAIEGGIGGNGHVGGDRVHHRDRVGGRVKEDVYEDGVDLGLLDRRLTERRDLFRDETDVVVDDTKEKFGLDKDGVNFANLSVVREADDAELDVELDIDFDDNKNEKFGINKGELYAYNFPSQGVGAGVGNSAIGAGSGAGAGLGAGIGEALYNGETVPTLGGIGTYSNGETPGEGGGVGGLIGGAGAGGAAGLYVGEVSAPLGVGPGTGSGAGGAGVRSYNYEHLPENGALHIMIHVDGSGSLLSTRMKLDEMKQTLLKTALLPYYNNDENLYDKRVTIVDSSGERTFQFFAQAADKDNVLAIAFQDEASPDYHLPNFNKVPQSSYSYDIGKLKASLNGYKGLYRGIMFQVDRGRTFSKSFKELVECAWNGEGYLSKENLKRYHRDDNQHLINTKRGVVFSDEYHAKSESDPEYYLKLIFDASKRIGLDLNSQGSGLSDGRRYNK